MTIDRLAVIYAENIHKLVDGPAWDDAPEDLRAAAVHMAKPFAPCTVAEFLAEIGRETSLLASQVDPALPRFPDENRKGWCAFPCSDEHTQPELTALAVHAKAHLPADEMGAEGSVLAVGVALVQRLSWWYTIPRAGVDEKSADFAFARLRCILSGFGYGAWEALSTLVLAQHAECPFDPNEDPKTWADARHAAHLTSGWPSTLLWWDWASLPEIEDDTCVEWLKILALAHVLKHVRRTPSRLVLAYQGLTECVPLNSNACRGLSQASQFVQVVPSVLRVPPKAGKKNTPPKGTAMAWALARLAADDLLLARPLAELPGEVIAGPWSTTLPSRAEGGFLCPGRRLVSVWRASGGKVTSYEGDETDILDWDWNLTDSNTPDAHAARTQFMESIPAEYPTCRPSRLLSSLFPHWLRPDPSETPHDFNAYNAIIDSLFCAGLLRSAIPGLAREFPLIMVLPAAPSAEDSTDQGKGSMTKAIAGAFVPGIDLTTASDSSSAPDSRAVADIIQNKGTIALDEYQVPLSRNHCLSRDNLQSLCTGGQVTSGRVFENSGAIRLKQPLVVNAKWLDLAEDLINRGIPLFLDRLSDEQRARTDIKMLIENGQAATALRLAAVSTIEQLKLTDLVANMRPGAATPNSWRFTFHRELAARIMVGGGGYTPAEAFMHVDSARASLGDDLRRHQQLADETGLSAVTSSGANLRLSWQAFWQGIDETSLQNIAGSIAIEGDKRTLEEEGKDSAPYVGLGRLCRLRMDQMGISGPLSRILPSLTGRDIRVSDTTVIRSLALQVRAYYATHLNARKCPFVPLPGEAGQKWECSVRPRSWTSDQASASAILVSIRPRS